MAIKNQLNFAWSVQGKTRRHAGFFRLAIEKIILAFDYYYLQGELTNSLKTRVCALVFAPLKNGNHEGVLTVRYVSVNN